ncbi:Fc receptor-like protein 5 [Sebastes fasciatus]|uniref:Fc receptor-like protein 5 n=1 Tax=Sebastes fasciatus TaxID=394691 RepID=UPI003D9E5D62
MIQDGPVDKDADRQRSRSSITGSIPATGHRSEQSCFAASGLESSSSPPQVTRVVEVLVLLVVNHGYLAQKTAFPRVHPDRLQFFEYETVRVDCEEFGGLTEWRVMTKLHESPSNSYWNSSAASCTIHPTFERHSGEFWCENEGGNTSAAVNIAVTAGSVILEVPARPVVEGYDVTLHCRKNKTQSKHIADFYKDGSRLGTRYEDNLMIQNVSKSDEGFYKCSISGAGDSPQSWLAVSKLDNAADEDTDRPHGLSPDPPSLLWVGVGVLVVALLLLVMGLPLCRKHRVSVCLSSGKQTSHSPGDHTDYDCLH